MTGAAPRLALPAAVARLPSARRSEFQAHPAPLVLIAVLARVLIVVAVPVSVIWFPIGKLEGFGTVALGDLLFLTLWVLTLAHLGLAGRGAPELRAASQIWLCASACCLLAGLGAATFDPGRQPLVDIGIHVKRFGFASILPLAMAQFWSRSMALWSVRLLSASLVFVIFLAIFPAFTVILPVMADRDLAARGARATGAFANANELAYFVTCAMVVVLSLRTASRAGLRDLFTYVTLGGGLVSIALSGSRSGVIGLLAASAYYVHGWRASIARRVGFVVVLGLAGFVGFEISNEFQSRISLVLTNRLQEDSFVARLQAQYVGVFAAIEYPMGVGFTNFPRATKPFCGGMVFYEVHGTDSLYIDTLLGAGVLGLIALLGVWRGCWMHLRSESVRAEGIRVLKAGCLAAFVFGLATVAPASVFVSTVFFFMIGTATYSRHRGRPNAEPIRAAHPSLACARALAGAR